MKLLAIETSCDETAVAVLDCSGDEKAATFKVLGNALLSQVDVHKEFGGVYPALAKREHQKNLVPLLEAALEEAELLHEDTQEISDEMRAKIAKILEREPELEEQFFEFVSECEPVAIDVVAVTSGPGLEPALWVGINFAKALSVLWEKPLIAVNHMEGHLLSSLVKDGEIKDISLPALGLLISGGHTELVLMKKIGEYELIGQTRDDAVGEAFDKVARLLDLPYPGGPEISKLAEEARSLARGLGEAPIALPRPMINSKDCDFSFAGLKTAVLYLTKKKGELSDEDKSAIALEFENAASDVLWSKTRRGLEETGAKTLAIGGGVSANTHIRRIFSENIKKQFPDIELYIPARELTTDNAVMIGIAGYFKTLRSEFADPATLSANGNLTLATK